MNNNKNQNQTQNNQQPKLTSNNVEKNFFSLTQMRFWSALYVKNESVKNGFYSERSRAKHLQQVLRINNKVGTILPWIWDVIKDEE